MSYHSKQSHGFQQPIFVGAQHHNQENLDCHMCHKQEHFKQAL